MISISTMQRINLEKVIAAMPQNEKEIAEKIYKKWDLLTLSSNDILLFLLLPPVIGGVVAILIIKPFLSEQYMSFCLLAWMIITGTLYYFESSLGFLKSKKLIDSNPTEKASFEKILEEPGAQEVLKKMKDVFNGRV